MRNPLLLAGVLAGLAATAAIAQPVPAQPAPAQPLALVIGNSSYTYLAKLPACELSANLAATTLSRAGFKVTTALNPSNAQMGAALATIADQAAAPGSRTVIYVCGYVSGYADRLFLLPREARLDRETDVLTQGIVARLLMSAAVAPGGAAGLVLMDYMPAPNQTGPIPFRSMLRPADEAHGGLAVAPLSASGNTVTGPLASALPDLFASLPVELGRSLKEMVARPDLAHSGAAAVLVPASPSVLLGVPGPAPAEPVEAGPAAPAAGPASLAVTSTADRRRIQLTLKNLGLFYGRVTGTFGPDTLAAIRRFQNEAGDQQTGQLTIQQASRLLDH